MVYYNVLFAMQRTAWNIILINNQLSVCFSSLGTLEPHLSGLLWTAMLISLAIVIALPKPHGIRALIASTILRLIFSVGLQPTLFLLGAFNVSFQKVSLKLVTLQHIKHIST